MWSFIGILDFGSGMARLAPQNSKPGCCMKTSQAADSAALFGEARLKAAMSLQGLEPLDASEDIRISVGLALRALKADKWRIGISSIWVPFHQ